MTTVQDHSNETQVASSALARTLTLAYGSLVYAYFLVLFLYLIGWVGNFIVPTTIDSGPAGEGFAALAWNLIPLGVFGIQHTIMARPAFKRWWTQFVPWHVERTTFVAITVAILSWMVVEWQAMPAVIWSFDGVVGNILLSISLIGWGIVLISTFLIDHFELFGIKQAVCYAFGRPVPTPEFRERWFYRHVRHPLMLGFMIAFWFAPTMTVGHLLFAAVSTSYVLVALFIEEQTLVELHGDAYEDYRARVPKIIPRLWPR